MRSFLILALGLALAAPSAAQQMTGSLDPTDSTRDGGELFDAHTIKVTDTRKLTVRMESPLFDTYLIVRSPSGVETVNDDFDGQEVSQVEVWATEPGEWTVLASQYSSEGGGAYTLDVTQGPIARLEVTEGRLDYADQVALKGEFYDTHTWEASAGDQVIFELLSLGFDGYLVVTSPSGRVWRNDDAGSTRIARVGPVAAAGKWRIDVTSNAVDETGAYDLRVIVLPKVD
ncbi:MAG: hypothetical protein HKN29_10885 [Rhodothermales bacterium]|nr:hypothetical protein [Rhodothermales bacterium]